MTHSLKRISYATCDPTSCLFSFMARDTASPLHLQQCHTFRLCTPYQAEELNTIVGTAFRAAYVLQLKREDKTVAKRFRTVRERREKGEQRMVTSRSSDDLLSCHGHNFDRNLSFRRSLASTTSAVSLVQMGQVSKQSACVSDRLDCPDRRQTVSPVTCPEYSQVFDMEDQGNLDSMAQDSGISSTSDSSNSYSSRDKHKVMEFEDLSRVPWYQGEMQR